MTGAALALLKLLAVGVLVAFVVAPELFAAVFRPLAQAGQPAIYTQRSLLELTAVHLALVAAATLAATVVALALAILATRPAGAEFLPLSRSLVNVGQTFPPVAVLALAVPAVGFGEAPALIALFLYGLLPIFESALGALSHPPSAVMEAARGAGMTEAQQLTQVELPLAWPAILSGVRLSAVIGLSTATIGSTVAARTLGEVVLAGLASNNLAFVVQGGALVAALAILISSAFLALERVAARRAGRPG